jgi:hypothetical protein
MESLCFTSTLFAVEPGEDAETNPNRFGKQLAAWLSVHLKALGYPDAEAIPEDWGWCVMCLRRPFLLWVGCGNSETIDTFEHPERTRSEPIIWQCFVEVEVPVFKRLFARPDTKPSASKLQSQLLHLLSSEPAIRMVECP